MHGYTKKELSILESPFAEIKRKSDILLSIGQLLLEYGASSQQITSDLKRVAAYLGIPSSFMSIHITYSTLMLNINGPEQSHTSFKKVDYKRPNMDIISAVSRLIWEALREEYTLEELEAELQKLMKRPSIYRQWFIVLSAAFGCGAFPILFGGSYISAWITTFCAILGYLMKDLLVKWDMNIYASIAVSAFIGSTVAYFSHYFFHINDVIYAMICCTLFMVPGIPLINAVDDLINNHLVSGITRSMHTLLTLGSMTIGLAMSQYFNRSYDFTHLSIVPDFISTFILGASIVASVGYAIMFNTPKRLLWLIAIGGFLTVTIKNSLLIYGQLSLLGATIIVSTLISILSLRVSKIVNTPSMVLAIPSVIPLVPGVYLYRFIFAILQIDSLDPQGLLEGVQSGVTAILIIISIAVGVSGPKIIAGRLFKDKKQDLVRHYIEERKLHIKS